MTPLVWLMEVAYWGACMVAVVAVVCALLIIVGAFLDWVG